MVGTKMEQAVSSLHKNGSKSPFRGKNHTKYEIQVLRGLLEITRLTIVHVSITYMVKGRPGTNGQGSVKTGQTVAGYSAIHRTALLPCTPDGSF